jgi:hypothetical protein
MPTRGGNPNGGVPHRTVSAASSAEVRTSGGYLQGANLDDDLQGHWLWRMCLEALLVFGSAENEEEFEASWSEPALLVQPLLIYHTLWYIGEDTAVIVELTNPRRIYILVSVNLSMSVSLFMSLSVYVSVSVSVSVSMIVNVPARGGASSLRLPMRSSFRL